MHTSNRAVADLVQLVRRRYRQRALLQGAAATVLTLAACLATTAAVYVTAAQSVTVLLVGAVVTTVVVTVIAALFLVRPCFRSLSDESIALFIEEHVPGMEDRLNAAVEATRKSTRKHRPLVDKLLTDAARKATFVFPETFVSRLRARLMTTGAAALTILLVVVLYGVLRGVDIGAAGFDLKAGDAFMTVSPGNVDIERGDSQRILATFRSEPEDDVLLVSRQGDGDWKREAMQRGIGEPAFQHEFLNVQESIDYWIEVWDVRSEPYRISMYEFPAVDRIDLTYRYPAYTGLRDRLEEDAGDIVGLSGSTVVLEVHATGSAHTASLEMDDGDVVALKPRGDGVFRGELTLEKDGLYTIRLTDRQSKQNRFPDQYRIVPEPDERPRITVTDPARDLRATAVEEVLIAADAEDDYGIKELRLAYSVNADKERVIILAGGGERLVSGEHLLFLEDYSLQAGDVISWYLEATDGFHPSGEATDMYFIEIIPFDQKYTQINNVGGSQSGQRQGGLVISQQEIIAATWKLIRELEYMSPEELADSHNGLVRAQTNLKTGIEERVASTAFSLELRSDPVQRQVADLLRHAIEAMDEAILDLTRGDLEDALTPERRALTNLLRADALNKEHQVARQQAGRGGGMSATEERMTELMDLELDISKDKYETRREGSQAANQSDEIDDALRKVKDLARRQENLTEQNRPNETDLESNKRFVDRLKREQDELRSQVEDLARSLGENSSHDGRLREGLDRTMRNMRQAERALRRENMDEALSRQQQALNELERLEQGLQRSARGTLRQRAEDVASDLEEMAAREKNLARELDRVQEELAARGGRLRTDDVIPLEEERQRVLQDAEDVIDRADDLRKDASASNPELATTLRNLLQQAQRDRLLDRLLDSREAIRNGWIDSAVEVERDILAALQNLTTKTDGLSSAVPVTKEETLAETLEELHDLEAELRRLEEQARRVRDASGDGRATRARMENQIERIGETLRRLQDTPEQTQQQSLGQLQSALSNASHTGVLLDEESADEFFNEYMYAPLSRLEVALSRELQDIELERKLYGGRHKDVPAQYREPVEKYFESLSRAGRRQ